MFSHLLCHLFVHRTSVSWCNGLLLSSIASNMRCRCRDTRVLLVLWRVMMRRAESYVCITRHFEQRHVFFTYILHNSCSLLRVFTLWSTIFPFFVIGLRVLENAINVPIVVNDVLFGISLEWTSYLIKFALNIFHAKFAEVAH